MLYFYASFSVKKTHKKYHLNECIPSLFLISFHVYVWCHYKGLSCILTVWLLLKQETILAGEYRPLCILLRIPPSAPPSPLPAGPYSSLLIPSSITTPLLPNEETPFCLSTYLFPSMPHICSLWTALCSAYNVPSSIIQAGAHIMHTRLLLYNVKQQPEVATASILLALIFF